MMMSRRKRQASTDEDEIAVHEADKPKQFKKRGRPAKNKKEGMENNREEQNLLADFDLEGVPEEEREQIKAAILASRDDNVPKNRYEEISLDPDEDMRKIETIDDVVEAGSGDVSDDDILKEESKQQPGDAIDLEEEVDDRCPQNTGDREPMEDEEEVHLHLSQSTLTVDDDETQRPESPPPVEETQDYEVRPSTSYVSDFHQDEKVYNEVKEQTQSQPQGQIDREGGQTSQRSTGVSQRSSQRSNSGESQESGGFTLSMQESGSQKWTTSDEPLQRHYRAVKYEVRSTPPFYCPEGQDIHTYAKIISQLVDIYNRKLCQAQKLARERLSWPEPVKTGQHHEKSIDAKRRGQDVNYFDLLDDNDDVSAGSSKIRPTKKVYRIDDSDDDDLPELVVEKHGRPRKARYNVEEAVEMISKGDDREPLQRDAAHGRDDNSDNMRGASARTTKLKKPVKTSFRKAGQVLVEDTQVVEGDDDFVDMGKKPKMDAVVQETQFCDEDEWLTLNNRTGRFNHKQHTDMLRTSDRVPESHVSDPGNETELNVRRNTGKKRKVETAVLVVNTQEFEVNDNKSRTRSKKKKPECFKIDSSSDGESVSETQNDPVPPADAAKEIGPQGLLGKIKASVQNAFSFATSVSEECGNADSGRKSPPVVKRSTRTLYNDPFTKYDKTPARNDKNDKNWTERDNLVVDDMFIGKSGKKVNKVTKSSDTKTFNRNASKDSILSNASDDVSIASSQVSTTLIDDNGDLFSTQFCEMRNVKQSGKKRKAPDLHQDLDVGDQVTKTPKKDENVVDSDDEDVVLIDITVKNNDREKVKDKNPQNTSHPGKRVTRHQKIDKCFVKVDKHLPTHTTKHVDNNDEYVKDGERDDENGDVGNDMLDEENPFPRTYSKQLKTDNVNRIKPVRDIETDEHIKGDVHMKSTSNWTVNVQNNAGKDDGDDEEVIINTTRSQSSVKHESQKASSYGWIEESFDPVDLEKFSRSKGSNRNVKHVEKQTVPEVVDVDSDDAEIQEEHENVPKQQPAKQTQQVVMIECPLCSREFSGETIQEHVEDCQGPVPGEEEQIQENNNTENGEYETCCICEKQIPKMGAERHVQECWHRAEQEQQTVKEEPVQTRLRKQRIDEDEPVVLPRRIAHRPREQVEPVTSPHRRGAHKPREQTDRYLPETSVDSGSTDGSSWDDSNSSSSDDNITLKSLVRSGSAALVTGPWHRPSQCNAAPDWLRNESHGSLSPIKSFVPISQQEDADYYHKQFNYNKEKVEKRMAKRKRTGTRTKRRKKRRKVRRKKTN